MNGTLPFHGAVLLGDSAYPLQSWLLTPFPGDPDGPKGQFNIAHIKTRNVVEQMFGCLKNRFYALKTGIRLKDPKEASKLIVSAAILHNLCIRYGDNREELSDDDEEGQEDEVNQAMPEAEEGVTATDM